MVLSIEDIERVEAYFRSRPVLRAWVFGSLARDEATERSDIDLLVELDYSQPVGLRFVEMGLELSERLGRPVDLVSARGLSPRIRPFMDADKRLIYERRAA
jgi:predicted nucleotidyltransferase